MTTPAPVPARPDKTPEGRRRSLPITILVLAPPAAFVVPFIGPLVATVATITLAATIGVDVWPVRRRTATLAAIAVVLSTVLVLGVVGVASELGNVLAFQLIPLCGPDPGTPWIVASLVAVAGYGLVAAASVRLGRIWLWPIAATVGAGLYLAAWFVGERAFDVTWLC